MRLVLGVACSNTKYSSYTYNLIAILSFIFISAAFIAYFLKIKAKQALLSFFFFEVLGSSSKEVNSEVNSKEVDGKVVDSKVAQKCR